MTTLLRDMNFSPWIGLVKQSDGTFRWVDNNDVTYTNWYQGEPNGIRGVVSDSQCTFIVLLKILQVDEKTGHCRKVYEYNISYL